MLPLFSFRQCSKGGNCPAQLVLGLVPGLQVWVLPAAIGAETVEDSTRLYQDSVASVRWRAKRAPQLIYQAAALPICRIFTM